mmetsp:Transcript_33550/g.74731  ORF Transcript_33550/g.74731 Transcript_33550/m.74731 type:complete len:261 (+) Transcript_33550:87-869(+)
MSAMKASTSPSTHPSAPTSSSSSSSAPASSPSALAPTTAPTATTATTAPRRSGYGAGVGLGVGMGAVEGVGVGSDCALRPGQGGARAACDEGRRRGRALRSRGPGPRLRCVSRVGRRASACGTRGGSGGAAATEVARSATRPPLLPPQLVLLLQEKALGDIRMMRPQRCAGGRAPILRNTGSWGRRPARTAPVLPAAHAVTCAHAILVQLVGKLCGPHLLLRHQILDPVPLPLPLSANGPLLVAREGDGGEGELQEACAP